MCSKLSPTPLVPCWRSTPLLLSDAAARRPRRALVVRPARAAGAPAPHEKSVSFIVDAVSGVSTAAAALSRSLAVSLAASGVSTAAAALSRSLVVSLAVSLALAPFVLEAPPPALAASRAGATRPTVQFDQEVKPRTLLREALPISLEGTPLASVEDLLEGAFSDPPARSAGTSRSIGTDELREAVVARRKQEAAAPTLRKASSVLASKADAILELLPAARRGAAGTELKELAAGISRAVNALERDAEPSDAAYAEAKKAVQKAQLLLMRLETEAAVAAAQAQPPLGVAADAPVLRGRAAVDVTLRLADGGA